MTSARLFLYRDSSGFTSGFPACAIGIVFGFITASPWFRWSNNFSLHTLLVITTVAAVLFGFLAWAARG